MRAPPRCAATVPACRRRPCLPRSLRPQAPALLPPPPRATSPAPCLPCLYRPTPAGAAAHHLPPALVGARHLTTRLRIHRTAPLHKPHYPVFWCMVLCVWGYSTLTRGVAACTSPLPLFLCAFHSFARKVLCERRRAGRGWWFACYIHRHSDRLALGSGPTSVGPRCVSQ